MRSYLILLSIVIAASACKHKPSPAPSSPAEDTPGPAISLGVYPLAVGHMWVYDSGDTITSVADTVINGTLTTKLIKSNGHYSYAIYCSNTSDGLRLIATNCSFPSVYASLVVTTLDNPSQLNILATPVTFTALPVALRSSWDAHVPNMKYAERQWLNYLTTTTPAGTFNCAVVRSGSLDEYYSEKGIVKLVDHPECFAAPCPEIVTRLVYVNF